MIELYLPLKGGIERAFDKAIPANLWPHVTRSRVTRLELPPMADYVIHAGEGAPQRAQEWMAANLKAMMVHLPQANGWLYAKVAEAIGSEIPLTLVDAGLATSKLVVKAS